MSAGAIGDAGSFSFQQSKVLTCGEGGAITCNDKDVYETCFSLKQVGWAPENPAERPYDDLVQANRYGHNYRITEMQAVLLRGGLSRLEGQIRIREESADYLQERLKGVGGPLQVVPHDPRVTRQSYYCLTLRFDPSASDGVTRDMYIRAAAAEGIPLDPTYGLVYKNRLLNLYDRTSPIPYRDPTTVQDYRNLHPPNAEKACNETAVVLSHTHLLGGKAYLDQLLDGIGKVNDNLPGVKRYFAENPQNAG